MPTEIPSPRPGRAHRKGRPLNRVQAVHFYWLFLNAVILDVRLHRAERRAAIYGLDHAGPGLLRASRRWVACHEAIAALLEIPEPDVVAQVRARLQMPTPPL